MFTNSFEVVVRDLSKESPDDRPYIRSNAVTGSDATLLDSTDTRTANGRLMLGLFALLSQFERDLMRERTKAGVEAAALSGKRVGRPPKITGDRIAIATDMAWHGRNVADIARAMGVSRAASNDQNLWMVFGGVT